MMLFDRSHIDRALLLERAANLSDWEAQAKLFGSEISSDQAKAYFLTSNFISPADCQRDSKSKKRIICGDNCW